MKTFILACGALVACSQDVDALRKRVETLENQVGKHEARLAAAEARQERRQASLAAVPRLPDFMADAAPHAAQDTDEQRDRLRQLFEAMAKAAGDEDTGMRAWKAWLRTLHVQANDFNRTLGFDILDRKGHVQDPLGVAIKMRTRVLRMYGGAKGLMVLRNLCGSECGSALYNAVLE